MSSVEHEELSLDQRIRIYDFKAKNDIDEELSIRDLSAWNFGNFGIFLAFLTFISLHHCGVLAYFTKAYKEFS